MVKINSGGAGEETGNPYIEDPEDAAASDTGEPGWLEKHKGGPGGGRKKRQLDWSALHRSAAARREREDDRVAQSAQPNADRAQCGVCLRS